MENFENMHHANIVLGSNGVLELLKEKLRKINFETRGNPDYLEWKLDTFGIDEARELTLWAIHKPIGTDKKVAIVVASALTPEAQNALLKTFEEPVPNTYFFVILPNIGGMIATLISRTRLNYEFVSEIKNKNSKNFIDLPLVEKLELIKKSSKNENKESLRDLIKFLPENMLQNSLDYRLAKKILITKKLSSIRGSSPKMLLEWLAATM